MFLNLHEKPYEFGIFSPTLISIFVIYYIVFFYGLYKYDKYKNHLNIVMDAFEEEFTCKIRIRKHKKSLEINWKPKIKEKEKAKGIKSTLRKKVSLSKSK